MRNPIEAVIELEFPNNEVARVVYESVRIEHETVPYKRTKGKFILEGRKVRLEFIAEDNSALRGTLNSYLRWIKVAMDSIEV
ncbi:KEOPS complex subunit Pcc1 [Thermococcus stetteri]|uniref:KEOPS complex subunit Pcc1 n=1 Tax=Thermococcus stetteri TaxID=49900 RepID=UPI001AE9D2DC|nr:KEOPS complex subunit Pcc1 [Thermococcus stetteri]MBP1912271.1 KEOPS complex subunit Pcc1 [Thermococcus stetteri]